MLRSILAIVLGYMALVFIVGIGVYGASSLLLGTTEVTSNLQLTPTYLAVNLLISFLAAIVAGYVTARLAPYARARHAQFLAGILLFVGLITAVVVTPQEAGQPTWYTWVIPFVGTVGVIIGGRLTEAAYDRSRAR